MRTVKLALTAALVGAPAAVIAQDQTHRLLDVQSWDSVTLLFAASAVLLIAAALGVVFATRAQRRREPQSEKERASPASLDELAIGHWVEEGRRFLNFWQERIERLDELQGRLAAMAQEIGQLRAQVSRIDELRAENLRLSQEGEALLLDRDQLRSILARIGELIQRASEARPGPAGGEAAAPEVGP
jgi:uncharacterized protein HemX